MGLRIMKQKTTPTFLALANALENTALILHPSEVHGILTGMLCSPNQSNVQWEQLIFKNNVTPETKALLHELLEITQHHLKEFLFDFELLMPEDSEALMQRAEGLTLWCQGFLTGLNLVHIPITGREKSETTEAINDIIEIAKMKYEDVVASEEDEAAYIELVEYVRMSVIFIYQAYQEADDKKQTESHYH